MEWSTILAAVPAISATVAVVSALSGWWKSRTWSSLEDARDLLREVSKESDTRLGTDVTEAASEAATVITLELTARAQQRAKRVAKRNGTSQFVSVTIIQALLFLLILLICFQGIMLGIEGEILGGADVAPIGAIAYFVFFGAISALGLVMGTVDRIGVWRQTRNKRSLYKKVAGASLVTKMPDSAPATKP